METTTPFDLNQAIQRWRENLGQSPAFHQDNLDELESHLRDSIASLVMTGLSTEEALMVASKRMGKISWLDSEFGKINSSSLWINRALWILIGVQMWWIASGISSLVARGTLSVGWSVFNLKLSATSPIGDMALPVLLCLLIQVIVLIAVILVCWRMLNRKGIVVKGWCAVAVSRNSRLAVCGLGLGLLYLMIHTFNFILLKLLALKFGPETYAASYVCFGYASAVAIVIQIVAITALTLIIAKKQSAAMLAR